MYTQKLSQIACFEGNTYTCLPGGPRLAALVCRFVETEGSYTPRKEGIIYPGRPRFGSVRLRFGGGTVRAVPVFGSGGFSPKRACQCFSTV